MRPPPKPPHLPPPPRQVEVETPLMAVAFWLVVTMNVLAMLGAAFMTGWALRGYP